MAAPVIDGLAIRNAAALRREPLEFDPDLGGDFEISKELGWDVPEAEVDRLMVGNPGALASIVC